MCAYVSVCVRACLRVCMCTRARLRLCVRVCERTCCMLQDVDQALNPDCCGTYCQCKSPPLHSDSQWLSVSGTAEETSLRAPHITYTHTHTHTHLILLCTGQYCSLPRYTRNQSVERPLRLSRPFFYSRGRIFLILIIVDLSNSCIARFCSRCVCVSL